MVELSSLYQKYGVSAPRLNCFPPASDWTGRRGRMDGNLPISMAGNEYAIYVHLPFCERRCGFCACNTSVARDERYFHEYEQALLQEMAWKTERWQLRSGRLKQIFIGVGTPTLFAPDALASLTRHLKSKLLAADSVEQWIELEPRVTQPAHIERLGEVGFEHAVFGIESYDERVQHAIQKQVEPQDVHDTVRRAKAHGFTTRCGNVLVGLPFQTPETLSRTLEVALQQDLNAISLYPYMHVPWVRPEKRAFTDRDVLNEEAKSKLYAHASQILLEHAFVDLGQGSFFAKDHPFVPLQQQGRLRRNYMGLGPSAVEHVVGLGVSAISVTDGVLGQSPKELGRYLQWASGAQFPFARWTQPNVNQTATSKILKRMWEEGVIDWEGVSWSPPQREVIERGLQTLKEDGLIESQDHEKRITALGRHFMHQISALFYFPSLNILPDEQGAP